MSAKRRVPGIGLLCSDDATVVRVVYDGLGLRHVFTPGRTFLSLLDATSAHQGAQFLDTIRQNKHADDWALKIATEHRPRMLRFWGSARGKFVHVIGAHTPRGAQKVRDEVAIKTRREEREPARTGQIDNQELRKKNAELEQLIAERTRWLGIAAHDLVHPIGAVLACSELLIEDDSHTFADDQKSLIESIHASAESMLKLLNDISSISAVESMDSPLSIEPTDLATLIRESISLNLALATPKSITFLFTNLQDIPPVLVDRQRMLQVFDNLFENAVKYCQSGAVVETRVSVEEQGVLISVSDNGPGIPRDEVDHLFTPFQKTRARAAAGQSGTGLGLAICKRVLHRHGGRIWVESSLGVGSKFHLWLPMPFD